MKLKKMNLIHKINKPLNLVFSYLTDMQKFVTVHPVITKIISCSSQEYLVYETMQMGFIPISFRYPVLVVQNSTDNTVNMKAIVMKLATIEMNFKLISENDFTVVQETINLQSILPIRRITENIFRKQHNQLFENIRKVN